jgi:S-adenosylmethionine synthetase
LARKVEVQLAYAIGVARPVGFYIDTYGTETVQLEKIYEAVDANFDLRPAAIDRDLDLRRPIYKQTAAYGHFGRPGLPWEDTSRAEALKASAGL